jgi:proteic killer suppression protein
MYRRYRDRRLERFTGGHFVKEFSAFERTLERCLRALESATALADIGSIPGHRLESLVGDRTGQYSIRINAQFRLCFTWPDDEIGAVEIEVVDYH